MSSNKNKMTRKSFIKKGAMGAAGLAFAGTFGAPAFLRNPSPNDTIGVAVIGFGIRARQMVGRMGYFHSLAAPIPTGFDTISREERTRGYYNKSDVAVRPFDKEQIRIVCDIYDDALKYAEEIFGAQTKYYDNYRKVLENKDIDCVMIFTPDHWHAKMAVDACEAGKDIFIEKCPTHSIEEGVLLKKTVEKTNRVVQLNESVALSPSTKKMREIVQSGMLGKVHTIRAYKYIPLSRRIWDWPIPSDLNENTINWREFLGPAPYRDFNPKRVIQWRCYWDYGTGVCGDLFSHTLAAINPIMDVHIPHTAVASGGVYALKDYFEVPDVYTSVYEYPDKDLSLLFNANFASSNAPRSTEFIGTDATMTSRGNEIYIWGEPTSPKYSSVEVKPGENKPSEVIKVESEDSMTSLEKLFHEFFDAVRTRSKTTCDINFAFDEDISCHLGTEAFLKGGKMTWDPLNLKSY